MLELRKFYQILSNMHLNLSKCYTSPELALPDLGDEPSNPVISVDQIASFLANNPAELQTFTKCLHEHIGQDASFPAKNTIITYLSTLLNLKLSGSEKISLKSKLIEGIEHCSNGYYNRVESVYQSFVRPTKLTQFLEKYRHTLIEQIARNFSDDVHDHKAFFLYGANHYGLIRSQCDDPHAVDLNEEEISSVDNAFERKYTPLKVLNELMLAIKDELHHAYGYFGFCTKTYEAGTSNAILTFFQTLLVNNDIDIQDVFILDDEYWIKEINWPWVTLQVIQQLAEQLWFSFSVEEMAFFTELYSDTPSKNFNDVIYEPYIFHLLEAPALIAFLAKKDILAIIHIALQKIDATKTIVQLFDQLNSLDSLLADDKPSLEDKKLGLIASWQQQNTHMIDLCHAMSDITSADFHPSWYVYKQLTRPLGEFLELLTKDTLTNLLWRSLSKYDKTTHTLSPEAQKLNLSIASYLTSPPCIQHLFYFLATVNEDDDINLFMLAIRDEKFLAILLKKLNPWQRYSLMSMQDEQKYSVLVRAIFEAPQSLEILLADLPVIAIDALLSQMITPNHTCLDVALQKRPHFLNLLLKNLETNEKIKLFSMSNDQGFTPLSQLIYRQNTAALKIVFELLTIEERFILLRKIDMPNKHLFLLLLQNTPGIFERFFDDFSSEQQLALLTQTHKTPGDAFMYIVNNKPELLTMVLKSKVMQDNALALRLLTQKTLIGSLAIWPDIYNLSPYFNLLEQLNLDLLKNLLFYQTAQQKSVFMQLIKLSCEIDRSSIRALLERLDLQTRCSLILQKDSGKDDALRTAITYNSNVFPILFDSFSRSQQYSILAKKNILGQNVLAHAAIYNDECVNDIFKNLDQNQILTLIQNVDNRGNNVLILAARNKRALLPELFNRLTMAQKFALLQQQNKQGNSALIMAARYKLLDYCASAFHNIVPLLLLNLDKYQRFALLQQQDNQGRHAVKIAAEFHPECLMALLALLDPPQKMMLLSQKDSKGLTPLMSHCIKQQNNTSYMVHVLANLTPAQRYTLLQHQDPEGSNIALYAIKYNAASMLISLLAVYSSGQIKTLLSLKNNAGESALMLLQNPTIEITEANRRKLLGYFTLGKRPYESDDTVPKRPKNTSARFFQPASARSPANSSLSPPDACNSY
ncbi:MAG: hypothetical protein CMF38_05025 [Legionellaceae bacterium]|nr:hypothetical protein [Legionellaceae bacterium]HCA89967.1 hypothetical protein [Legionellales bacterium]|tara:strand:+ start:2043 stop:5495 length:3453 start_codon:yes stop_codon:yes gene_type:complete